MRLPYNSMARLALRRGGGFTGEPLLDLSDHELQGVLLGVVDCQRGARTNTFEKLFIGARCQYSYGLLVSNYLSAPSTNHEAHWVFFIKLLGRIMYVCGQNMVQISNCLWRSE
jgi:hypothetical protein